MSKSFKFENVTYYDEENGYYYAQVVGGKKGRIPEKTYLRALERSGKTPKLAPEPTYPTVTVRPLEQVTRKSQIGGLEIVSDDKKILLTRTQVAFWDALKEMGFEKCLPISTIVDYISWEFAENPMKIGAMISTFSEKGLMSVVLDPNASRKVKIAKLTIFGASAYEIFCARGSK